MINLSTTPEDSIYNNDLTKFSQGEKIIQKKRDNIVIAKILAAIGETTYEARLKNCATHLNFAVTESGNLKLYGANFCRVRCCPICQWRRTKKWEARTLSKLDDLAILGSAKLITLTMKSCRIVDMGKGIDTLQNALKKFLGTDHNRSQYPIRGAIKTYELNRSKKTGKHCNPHAHILVFTDEDYYFDLWKVQKHWKECLGVDYNPIIDIRMIDPTELQKGILEVVKYTTKSTDLKNAFFLKEWIAANHKRRQIELLGEVRKIIGKAGEDLENFEEELIQAGGNTEKIAGRLPFKYLKETGRYVLTDPRGELRDS